MILKMVTINKLAAVMNKNPFFFLYRNSMQQIPNKKNMKMPTLILKELKIIFPIGFSSAIPNRVSPR